LAYSHILFKRRNRIIFQTGIPLAEALGADADAIFCKKKQNPKVQNLSGGYF